MARFIFIKRFLMAFACMCAVQAAAALTALEDDELSAVRGAGVAFNLVNYSLSGDLSLTYAAETTADNVLAQYIALNKLTLFRSDDPASTFSDPYRLSIIARPGLPDVIRIAEPRNANGLLKWQFATDWVVGAEGSVFNGGSLLVQDYASYGGTLDVTSPATPGVESVVFGKTVHFDMSSILLRPRGRTDTSNELQLSGIHVGAADGVTAWVMADVTAQPGIFNAVTEGGQSYLHLGISWPIDPTKEVPAARVAVDNITFRNDQPTYTDPVTQLPTSTLNLGASRIESMQLQYLDVKLRAGP